jgi:hypothetical protein
MKKIITIISIILIITIFSTTNLFALSDYQEITYDGVKYTIEINGNLFQKQVRVTGENETNICTDSVFSDKLKVENINANGENEVVEIDRINLNEEVQYSENVQNEATKSYYKKYASRSLTYNGKKYSYAYYKHTTLSSSSSKKYKVIIYAKGKKKTRYYKKIPTIVHKTEDKIDEMDRLTLKIQGETGGATAALVAAIWSGPETFGIGTVISIVVASGFGLKVAFDLYDQYQASKKAYTYFVEI